MNKFQYAEKINANTKLSFANKAIINQIISFQLNQQEFHGTDEYLASTWGVSPRTIQRNIAELKKLNLIQVELDKKKHSTGDKTWYNKRYITVDLINLSNFLQDNTSIDDSKPIKCDLSNDIQTVESSTKEDIIMSQIEEKSNDFFDENSFDLEEDNSEYFESLMNVNPKQVEETLIVNYTPTSEPKDNTIQYSNIEFNLNNTTVVLIRNEWKEYWNDIQLKPRVISNLRKCSSQYMFDRELNTSVKHIKTEKELMAKYSLK